MLKGFGVVAAGCAVMLAATAPALAAEPTPDGPATLMNRWTGASTLEGRPPAVLVGVGVVVGEGSRAGTIRVRASNGDASGVSDPVELPAAPGEYTLPAPQIPWDDRTGSLGIDQTTGGHALIGRAPCRPEPGEWADPCEIQRVEVFAPGDLAKPTDAIKGGRLALTGLSEPDLDRDLAGDKTQDRTDLRASATTTRGADGRLRTAVTVTNAGPRTADLPALLTTRSFSRETDPDWEAGCKNAAWPVVYDVPACLFDALPVGASRTLVYISDGPGRITVRAEGPDLAPADNVVPIRAPRLEPTVQFAGKQSLRRGIKVRVMGEGRARVTAALKVRKRTVRIARAVTLRRGMERTVTLRARGAKLRTLKRAAARGPLRATVTVRAPGAAAATAATTVRR